MVGEDRGSKIGKSWKNSIFRGKMRGLGGSFVGLEETGVVLGVVSRCKQQRRIIIFFKSYKFFKIYKNQQKIKEFRLNLKNVAQICKNPSHKLSVKI